MDNLRPWKGGKSVAAITAAVNDQLADGVAVFDAGASTLSGFTRWGKVFWPRRRVKLSAVRRYSIHPTSVATTLPFVTLSFISFWTQPFGVI